ncbi:MAG TPA: prolyl oligopeptidase family serine peptidase, partial [Acidimicrobiales bacterium]|nr:prolyl oligopeptidase family serine peptidase [Acidimicrobiales bacterium]
PRPDRRGGHAIYRDVCFARVDGFRSLLLDLRVPEGGDGASAGGHLALLAALTAGHPDLEGNVGVPDRSSAVAACASWFGPTEFLTMTEQAPPGAPGHEAAGSPESRLIGAPLRSAPGLAAAASPISYVSASAPPILLVHGTVDRVVPYAQSVSLAERLEAVGAVVTLLPVADGDHGFAGGDAGAAARATMEFFDRELSAPAPAAGASQSRRP